MFDSTGRFQGEAPGEQSGWNQRPFLLVTLRTCNISVEWKLSEI